MQDLKTVISPIKDIISDFSAGKMVILVDDEDRENEGDLIIPAQDTTPEAINFMAAHGRGLICLTLTDEHCQRLNLPLMVKRNNARYSTNFTVSIEAAEGVTTGISAADRATTILAAINPEGKAEDIVMPGHIFPIMAQSGGVLSRAGHTEAGVDLARISGKIPSSVICEILNPDGTMARLPELAKFAAEHDIKIGTIADLISYRLENEPTVSRLAQSAMQTPKGQVNVVAYRDTIDDTTHHAMIFGELNTDEIVPVRVQVSSPTSDVLQKLNIETNWDFDNSYHYLSELGNGVLVWIQSPETSAQAIEKIRTHAQQQHADNGSSDEESDLRILGIGGQILYDLGVRRMQVLGTPKKMHGLSGFSLEVVEFIAKV